MLEADILSDVLPSNVGSAVDNHGFLMDVTRGVGIVTVVVSDSFIAM